MLPELRLLPIPDAQTRIPRVVEPLEFEDGQAWLMKTDILQEMMYFSYEKGSLANLFPVPAAKVAEIIKMNRNGIKAESLKTEPDESPEFVTAVGDDSISRFDAPKGRNRRGGKGQRGGQGRGQQSRGGKRSSDRPARPAQARPAGAPRDGAPAEAK